MTAIVTWIISNKRWTLIIVLSILYLSQIAYTNHLARKFNAAEAACAEKIQKIEQANLKALAEKQNEINQVSADYEKAKSEQRVQVETVTKTVHKIIERPVYSNVCFDDDGLQQLNRLIKANGSS